MANILYPIGKKAILDGSIDFLNDDIKIAAMNTSHAYNASHDFYDDVNANTIQTSANLGTKSTTGGTFDAADLAPAYTSVATNITALVLYKDSGTPSSSPLIAHIDTGTGLPHTQDGGNVDLTFNGSGIFSI